jgi:hypothetical protein
MGWETTKTLYFRPVLGEPRSVQPENMLRSCEGAARDDDWWGILKGFISGQPEVGSPGACQGLVRLNRPRLADNSRVDGRTSGDVIQSWGQMY